MSSECEFISNYTVEEVNEDEVQELIIECDNENQLISDSSYSYSFHLTSSKDEQFDDENTIADVDEVVDQLLSYINDPGPDDLAYIPCCAHNLQLCAQSKTALKKIKKMKN